MKNFYSKIILCMLFFYDNILYTSEYDQKEFARTKLIHLIESTMPILDLEKFIKDFIEKYPVYKSEKTPFCLNRSLFEHLKFHGKEYCWPKEFSLESSNLSISQFFTDFQDASAAESRSKYPCLQSNLSLYGCGKTNLACAFTCQH